jgi:hypothetical protein
MFPPSNARIERNEAGEVLGWDIPPDPDMGDIPDDEAYYDIEDDDNWIYCDVCEEYVTECEHTKDYVHADEEFSHPDDTVDEEVK